MFFFQHSNVLADKDELPPQRSGKVTSHHVLSCTLAFVPLLYRLGSELNRAVSNSCVCVYEILTYAHMYMRCSHIDTRV
jgi:hypothetical protein